MKPAWDKLGDEYADSSSVLIGDADCTGTGEVLCKANDVKGYPTIKYFVDGDTNGQAYQGGRDYDSLKAFVEESLEIKCDIAKQDVGCSDKEKGYIEKMKAKGTALEAEKEAAVQEARINAERLHKEKEESARLSLMKLETAEALALEKQKMESEVEELKKKASGLGS